MQIKIVDELGQEQPEKQVGEILLKGPNVVSGYLNQRQPENGQQMVGLKQATWAI